MISREIHVEKAIRFTVIFTFLLTTNVLCYFALFKFLPGGFSTALHCTNVFNLTLCFKSFLREAGDKRQRRKSSKSQRVYYKYDQVVPEAWQVSRNSHFIISRPIWLLLIYKNDGCVGIRSAVPQVAHSLQRVLSPPGMPRHCHPTRKRHHEGLMWQTVCHTYAQSELAETAFQPVDPVQLTKATREEAVIQLDCSIYFEKMRRNCYLPHKGGKTTSNAVC